MIPPLDVDGRVLHEKLENTVGTVAAVKEIADDMDALDREAFDEDAERLDKVCSAPDLHDGLDQLFIVVELCLVQFGARTQQLHNDGFVAFRDIAAHLARRKFPEIGRAHV